MRNEDLYNKEVEDASLIRYEINEDHGKELSALYKIYKNFFNRNPSEFRLAKDIVYYKGGWPKETTLPKAQQLANKIADAYMVLSYIGLDGELNDYLADRGLKIVPVIEDTVYTGGLLEDIDWQLDNKRKKAVENNWEELFDYDMPTEPKDLLTALMNRACDKQKIVCELADKIKIDKGEEVQDECDVKVGHFVRAVNLKYKVQKGKDISDALVKIEEDAEQSVESLKVFD